MVAFSREVRGRGCPLCGGNVKECRMFDHMRICTTSQAPQNRHMPVIGLDNGAEASYVVGGCSKEIVRMLDAVFALGDQHWTKKGTRPEHRGRLAPFGWCKRWKMRHRGHVSMQASVASLYALFRELPIFHKFNTIARHREFLNVYPNAKIEQLPPLIFNGLSDGTNCYFGDRYMAINKAFTDHAPPPPVARWLKVASCHEKCEVCRTSGCIKCAACPIHLDRQDATLTALVQHQPRSTPMSQACFFVLGDRCYPIRDGFTAIFPGALVPHGLWAPQNVSESYPWRGAAFVKRT